MATGPRRKGTLWCPRAIDLHQWNEHLSNHRLSMSPEGAVALEGISDVRWQPCGRPPSSPQLGRYRPTPSQALRNLSDQRLPCLPAVHLPSLREKQLAGPGALPKCSPTGATSNLRSIIRWAGLAVTQPGSELRAQGTFHPQTINSLTKDRQTKDSLTLHLGPLGDPAADPRHPRLFPRDLCPLSLVLSRRPACVRPCRRRDRRPIPLLVLDKLRHVLPRIFAGPQMSIEDRRSTRAPLVLFRLDIFQHEVTFLPTGIR